MTLGHIRKFALDFWGKCNFLKIRIDHVMLKFTTTTDWRRIKFGDKLIKTVLEYFCYSQNYRNHQIDESCLVPDRGHREFRQNCYRWARGNLD